MENNLKKIPIPNGYKISSWKDTTLVLLVLFYSGNPAPGCIFPIEPQLILLALFFFFLLVRQSSRQLFSNDSVIIATVFIGILLTQTIIFSFFPFITWGGFFLRLFIGYALIHVINNFPRSFVHAMVCLSLTSLVIYIPSVLLLMAGFNVTEWASKLSITLGTYTSSSSGYGYSIFPLFIHTFRNMEQLLRNAGIFWEPGAFQGYLILALIFLTFCKDDMPQKQYRRALQVLCGTVLTTLSTTGYIALAMLPLLHYEWRGLNLNQSIFRILIGVFLLLPLLVGGSFSSYKSLPFLGEKIALQLETLDRRERNWHRGRIGSLVFDKEYIERRPLTGWGPHPHTRYALHPWMTNSEGMGNGMSDFIVKFGLLGFMTWLSAVFLGFRRLSGNNKAAPILTCCLLVLELQGEAFLGYPLFLSLAFLSQIPVHQTKQRASIIGTHPNLTPQLPICLNK